MSEIYGTLSGENFVYVKQLAKISPETKVFSNMEPTMMYYDKSQSGVNLTIGKDAVIIIKNVPMCSGMKNGSRMDMPVCADCLRHWRRYNAMRGLEKISDTICTGSVRCGVCVI